VQFIILQTLDRLIIAEGDGGHIKSPNYVLWKCAIRVSCWSIRVEGVKGESIAGKGGEQKQLPPRHKRRP